MSNRQIKYPGLKAGAKTNGIDYRTALSRIRTGMSIADACSIPVRHKGVKIKRPHMKHGRKVSDKSPIHIRELRTAYCDQFMKTGYLDPEIAVKLRKYAYECKTTTRNSRRISAEHEAENYRASQSKSIMGSGRGDGAGDDRFGDGPQADAAP